MKKKRVGKHLVAAGLATMLVTTGLAVSAQGETLTKSSAAGQFLSGSIAGQNLSQVVELKGTTAANPGNAGPNTNPLQLSVLQAITIGQPINVPLAELLSPSQGSAGVANHYAAAPSRTKATGASGAVRDSGGVLTTDSTSFPSNAKISFVGGPLGAIDDVTGANLEIGALYGSSEVDGSKLTRDYGIASLTANLTIPLLADILDDLADGAEGVDVNTLTISPATLCSAVSTIDVSASGLVADLTNATQDLLDALDGQANDTFNLCSLTGGLLDDPALADLIKVEVKGVGDILKGVSTLTANGVTIDLVNGKVTIDLAALVKAATGNDLNNQPPNTDLLQAITSKLGSTISDLLENLSDGVLERAAALTVSVSVNGTPVVTDAGLSDLTGMTDLSSQFETLLKTFTDALTPVLEQLDGPLGDLADALSDVLSLTVNNQTSTTSSQVITRGADTDPTTNATVGRFYQESALRVDVLGAASSATGGPLVSLELAAAEAGLQPDEVDTPDETPPPTTTTGSDDGGVTTTLPNTGAPNVLPFFVLGLVLLAAGASTIITERRREAALAALA